MLPCNANGAAQVVNLALGRLTSSRLRSLELRVRADERKWGQWGMDKARMIGLMSHPAVDRLLDGHDARESKIYTRKRNSRNISTTSRIDT